MADAPWTQSYAPAANATRNPWEENYGPDQGAGDSGKGGSVALDLALGPLAKTKIPQEVVEAGGQAISDMKAGFNPFSPEHDALRESLQKALAEDKSPWSHVKAMAADTRDNLALTGKALLGIPGLVAAPITGASRWVAGKALSAIGVPYDEGKYSADTAMMGLMPARGGVPVPPRPTAQLGVVRSMGQEARSPAAAEFEQRALRGVYGEEVRDRARAFQDQQGAQIDAAQRGVKQVLDAQGNVIADDPQQAGAVAAQGVRSAEIAAGNHVDNLYADWRSRDAEIHAAAFEGIGQRIKGELSSDPQNPIIINDRLTPNASAAIQHIDDRVANLQIQNRADPFGQPDPSRIVGVNLQGVDQWRKELSQFRAKAWEQSEVDGRAASAVTDAFDRAINDAYGRGLYSGDPDALGAWRTAQQAHSDYRTMFGGGRQRDMVSNEIQKIIGPRNGNDPLTANDVADALYGKSGLNPTTKNVGVARRVREILGADSPEYSGVRQGLWDRISSKGTGQTEFAPGVVANRINKFLNSDGRELANEMFSPAERRLMQSYANLMSDMRLPQSAAQQWNAPFFERRMGNITSIIGASVGALLGHTLGLPYGDVGGAAAGAAASSVARSAQRAANMRRVERQMPLVGDALRQWQRAYDRATAQNTPPSHAAFAVATGNLADKLRPLGLTLSQAPQENPPQYSPQDNPPQH